MARVERGAELKRADWTVSQNRESVGADGMSLQSRE
jgi:hypothetical protein